MAKRNDIVHVGTIVKMGARKGIVVGTQRDFSRVGMVRRKTLVCRVLPGKHGGGAANRPLSTGILAVDAGELLAVGKAKKIPWQCLSHLKDFKRLAKAANPNLRGARTKRRAPAKRSR